MSDEMKLFLILVPIEDWEVDQYWRRWVPVEDEGATDADIDLVGLSPKQLVLVELRRAKRKILDGVYETRYREQALIVKFRSGELYVYNWERYRLDVRQDGVYLIDVKSNEEKRIYDYESGVFKAGKYKWLRIPSGKFGKRENAGVQWGGSKRGNQVLIKNYQIIAVLYFGRDALYAVGQYGREFDINHRNLNNEDDRIVNLELVSPADNKRHGDIMYELLQAKVDLLISRSQ
jgi:hypothetical protein